MDEELAASVMFSFMLLLSIVVGHWLHLTRFKWATEGSVALLVGLCAGGLFVGVSWITKQPLPGHLLEFDNSVFFNVLLPPIIFNAGLSIKKKLFFANFVTLALFGIVGTFASAALIGAGSLYTLRALDLVRGNSILAALALGAIFSSTDSVATLQVLNQDTQPMLFSLVFGEGVCNDATAIVLLGAVSQIDSMDQLTLAAVGRILVNFSYLFVCSLALGIAVGLLSAIVIKRMFKSHSTDREVLVVALMGFIAYAVAQLANLSGIFSVFFCGVTMSHYTWHSLSPSAKVLTIYVFRILSFSAEVFLFIYSGFDMWSATLWHDSRHTQVAAMGKVAVLTLSLLGLVLLSRGVFVSLLCLLANTWRKARISLRDVAVIWWAGVMRGAITIALVYHFFYDDKHSKTPKTEREIIVVSAMGVILITTLGFGALTKPLVGWLLFEPACPPALQPRVSSEFFSQPVLNPDQPGTRRDETGSWLHHMWRMYDSRLLQPLFGGRKRGVHEPHSPGGPLRRVIERASMRLHRNANGLQEPLHRSASGLHPDEAVHMFRGSGPGQLDRPSMHPDWQHAGYQDAYRAAHDLANEAPSTPEASQEGLLSPRTSLVL